MLLFGCWVVVFVTDEPTKEADLIFVFGDVKISVDVVPAVVVVVEVNGKGRRAINEWLVRGLKWGKARRQSKTNGPVVDKTKNGRRVSGTVK